MLQPPEARSRFSQIGSWVKGFFAIPWCCVLVFAATLVTSTSSIASLWIDELIHSAMPFLIALHVWGIVYYICNPQAVTRKRTWFLVGMTIVFVMSASFHLTPWHDQLLGIEHQH